jgi:hypothetical protein
MYWCFLIGALKKKCCMSYSKSCWIERPIMAAMTITPSEPRKLVVNMSERGESISWLPKVTLASLKKPPAAIIHSMASARKPAK